eukprot:403361972
MGCCNSKTPPQNLVDLPLTSPTLSGRFNQKDEDLLKSLLVQKKLLDNRLVQHEDEFEKFQQELKNKDSEIQNISQEAQEILAKKVEQLDTNIKGLKTGITSISDSLKHLQETQTPTPGHESISQQLQNIEEQIKQQNEKVNASEKSLKQLKDLLSGLLDQSKLLDQYNKSLKQLEGDLPKIKCSVEYLKANLQQLETLVQNGLNKDQQNQHVKHYQEAQRYIQDCRDKDLRCLEISKIEAQDLSASQLATQYAKVQDIAQNKENGRKEYERIKESIRKATDVFIDQDLLELTRRDMNLLNNELEQQLKESVKIQENIQNLTQFEKILKQFEQKILTQKDQITRTPAADLYQEQEKLSQELEEILKNLQKKKIHDNQRILHEQVSQTQELLKTINDVQDRLPAEEREKIEKLQKYIQNIDLSADSLAMNTARANEIQQLEGIAIVYQDYILQVTEALKTLQNIEIPPEIEIDTHQQDDQNDQDPDEEAGHDEIDLDGDDQSNDDDDDQEEEKQETQASTHLEDTITTTTTQHKAPLVIEQKFTNQVDQLMYEFQLKRDTDLIFKKVSENSYIIGTRKVAAKVTNGILLVRVGGGFMDIDSFFKQYGKQELDKQHRAEEKLEKLKHQDDGLNTGRSSIDAIASAKNAANKFVKIKNTAQKAGGGRNSALNQKQVPTPSNKAMNQSQQNSSVNGAGSSIMSNSQRDDQSQSQPGEYEIDLGDDMNNSGIITNTSNNFSNRASPDPFKRAHDDNQ